MDYTGQQITNYRVVAKLGEGSYGAVYRAEHIHLPGKVVAIKFLLDTVTDPRERRRFEEEAQKHAKLNHPRIVRLLDFGTTSNGTPYLITDFISGRPLDDRLRRQGTLSVGEAVKLLGQVGDALSYAHAQGIIHRDLKPENILIDVQDKAVLVDFGIAEDIGTRTSTRATSKLGTVEYVAPEYVHQQEVSPELDQYALGCIAYEMLTGQTPFSGADKRRIMLQHIHEQPVAPSQLNPQIPPYIDQAILKALEKDRHSRHASVAAFITALQTPPKVSHQIVQPVPQAVQPAPLPPLSPGLPQNVPALQAQPQALQPTNPASTLNVHSPNNAPAQQPFVPRVQAATPSLKAQHSPLQPLPNPNIQPVPIAPPNPSHGRRISRRVFMVGAAATVAVVAIYEGLPRIGALLTNVSGTPNHQPKSPTRTVAIHETGDASSTLVAWSPNGKHLAIGSASVLQVWDPLANATGVNFHQGGLGPNGSAIAWSPDGKRIAEDGANISIFDASSGSRTATFNIFSQTGASGVAWSPNGKLIATCIQQANNSAIWIGDATKRGNIGADYNYSSPYQWGDDGYTGTDITCSPDGRRIAAVGMYGGVGGEAQVWDVASGKAEFVYRKLDAGQLTYNLSWSPNGKYILLTDQKKLLIWNFSDGVIITTYNGHGVEVLSAAWSPDGKHIASSDVNATVLVWNAISGKTEVVYQEHANSVTDVDWSPVGKYIASGSSDGMVRVWTPWSG